MKRLIGLVMGIVLTGALAASVPVSASLVAYWDMNEGSGTLVGDVVGSNDGTIKDGSIWPPGTFTGNAWTADAGGYTGLPGDYALDFSGNNAMVDAGSDPSLNLTNTVSIDFWIKADRQSQYPPIISKRRWWGDAQRGWEVKGTCGLDGIGIGVQTDATAGIKDMWIWEKGVLDNEWHHLVWVLDNGSVTGYLDGRQEVTASYTPGIYGLEADNAKLYIGLYGKFNGLIDNVKIYNHAIIIPEPGSLLLLGTGLVSLVSLVRRKRG